MPASTPTTLALLAALALAVAPGWAVVHHFSPLIGILGVALVLVAAWGLGRRAGWSRWLVTLLAALSLWTAARTWWLPLAFRHAVPGYPLWRGARIAGAVLLVGSAATAWLAARETRPDHPLSENSP
jgi:hypothetical protein